MEQAEGVCTNTKERGKEENIPESMARGREGGGKGAARVDACEGASIVHVWAAL